MQAGNFRNLYRIAKVFYSAPVISFFIWLTEMLLGIECYSLNGFLVQVFTIYTFPIGFIGTTIAVMGLLLDEKTKDKATPILVVGCLEMIIGALILALLYSMRDMAS